MAKAIAKNENDMVVVDRPDWMQDSNRGSENVTVDDLTIPRLEVVQSLSPQRKRNDPAYIEGAEEGQFFNTVTNELYGTSVLFVPVYFRKEWNIWRMRTEGGGFRGSYQSKERAVAEIQKLEDMEVCEIIDTAQHFGMIIDPNKPGPVDDPNVDEVVISMTRSKMKVSRLINSMVKMAGGDRFSRIYRLDSVSVDGTKGDYQSYTVKSLGYTSRALFQMAEVLYESIASGSRDVKRDDDTAGTVDPGEAGSEY